jgi:CRISPR-associated protein Csh1
MLEAIREIGSKIITDEASALKAIESLVESSDNPKVKGKKVIILDFNIFEKKLAIDFEEVKDETPLEYLWLRTEAGRTPPIYFTSEKLSYLISKVIPNIFNKISKNSELGKLLKLVIGEIFYDLGLSKEYKYILDIEKFRIVEKGYIGKLLDNSKKKNIKESDIFDFVLKNISSKVSEYIINKGFSKKDFGLFTLKINGKLMAENKEYKELIAKEKIDSLFGKMRKICSACNANDPVSANPEFSFAKSALGFYMTDKVGFSSSLSGEFTRNFVLCKSCYTRLLAGEVFVRNNLSAYIGGLNLYITPRFLLPVNIDSKKLIRWAKYIGSTFNSAKSFKQLEEFEKKLEEYKEFEDSKNSFILNLLFYKSGQRNIKVLKLIKDVPPTRLKLLGETTKEIRDSGDKRLGQSNQWSIDLQTIYFLIPLRKSKNDIEYRKILSLYDSIFTGKPVSYSFLISQFVELAQVYRFEKFSAYNIGKQQNPDIGFVYAMLKANLFLVYLQKLNLLNIGGKHMDYDILQLEEEIKMFLKEMGYDESRVALFLLGYLVGQIGNAQYNKGKSKPILGKITFQGMNKGKLMRLTNDVFEKLIEYKQLSFNETIFAEYKKLLDQHIETRQLQDHENVFYVLSGYAYATHRALQKSEAKKSKKQTIEEVKTDESGNTENQQ